MGCLSEAQSGHTSAVSGSNPGAATSAMRCIFDRSAAIPVRHEYCPRIAPEAQLTRLRNKSESGEICGTHSFWTGGKMRQTIRGIAATRDDRFGERTGALAVRAAVTLI